MPPEEGDAAPMLSDEEWSDDDDNEYMLGFAEEAPAELLLRHHFPSKLGGRPAWLDPVNLPTTQQLTCPITNKPLNFLLQVYAPLDDDVAHDGAFHRAIYVFVTPQGNRVHDKGAVRALRCQLPRRNDFYAYDPPTEEDKLPQQLPAEVASQSLERDPWRVLEAERSASAAGAAADQLSSLSLSQQTGSASSQPAAGKKHSLVLFPERELVVEPEDREAEEENTVVQKLLSEYESKVEAEGELTEDELPPEVLDEVEGTHTVERQHFAMFQARMEAAPDQVIRYCFKTGAHPLWPSPSHLPAASDIPPCPHCKQARRFEFQVMPQLLNVLDQDELSGTALDWGTIAVYSCPTSCQEGIAAAKQQGSAYVDEFVWVQPPT